jgi:hypothetical protein
MPKGTEPSTSPTGINEISLKDIFDATTLRLILDKLQKADEFNRRQFEILSKENQRRAAEIKKLSNAVQMTMVSEDGSSKTSTITTKTPNEDNSDTEDESEGARAMAPPAESFRTPHNVSESERNLLKAKDAIELVETLRSRDDVGVEDFIKNVRYARSYRSQKELLLKLILVTRITESAKRNIRFIEITSSYEQLYGALRQNISFLTTVSNC